VDSVLAHCILAVKKGDLKIKKMSRLRKTSGFICIFVYLFAFHAFGLEYYVATSGSDCSRGTKASPWRTLEKAANTAVAGDVVFVKAGIYKGPLRPKNSGTRENYITFKAFASDEVIIEGGYEVTKWSVYDGNIYSAPWKSSFLQAEWEGITQGALGFVNVDNSIGPEYWPSPISELEKMTENSWYYDRHNNRLYLWMTGGANPNNHTIYSSKSDNLSRGGIRTRAILGNEYVRFENFKVRLYYSGIHISDSQNIEVNNIEIYNVRTGISNHSGTNNVLMSNIHIHDILGVGIQNNGSYATITNCKIHDNGLVDWGRWTGGPGVILMGSYNVLKNTEIYNVKTHGVYLETWGTRGEPSPDTSHHNVVENCIIYNAGSTSSGIYFDGSDYNIVRNNIIYDCFCGIRVNKGGRGGETTAEQRKAYNNKIYNNTIANSHWYTISIGEETFNTEIYNNIFYESSRYLFFVSKGDSDIAFKSDNNSYYCSAGFQARIRGKETVTYTDLATFSAATGEDGNSIVADPLFKNIAGNDFSLKTGSPCIDSGMKLDGIEFVNKPDMGAIQYIADE
jgi:parallel beta-helix repeat protein